MILVFKRDGEIVAEVQGVLSLLLLMTAFRMWWALLLTQEHIIQSFYFIPWVDDTIGSALIEVDMLHQIPISIFLWMPKLFRVFLTNLQSVFWSLLTLGGEWKGYLGVRILIICFPSPHNFLLPLWLPCVQNQMYACVELHLYCSCELQWISAVHF